MLIKENSTQFFLLFVESQVLMYPVLVSNVIWSFSYLILSSHLPSAGIAGVYYASLHGIGNRSFIQARQAH